MKERKDIAIIHEHYHYADIGVRTVLDRLIDGIEKYSGKFCQYLWYSPFKYSDRDEPYARYEGSIATVIEDRNLGYALKPYPSIDSFMEEVRRRKNEKLLRFSSLLQCHRQLVHIIQNPTLLKNPVETYVNALIAEILCKKEYISLWHIHDFLEDSNTRTGHRLFIDTFAGEKTLHFFGKSGSGISWNTIPSIFYITINRKDQWALRSHLLPHLKDTIFHLPDPVDSEEMFSTPADSERYDMFDERLLSYAIRNEKNGFHFRKHSPILIAAEMARERKNSVEQILILNLLNTNRKENSRSFQLLVTLLPSQGKDLERIEKITEYLKKRKLGVVMGFGRELIVSGDRKQDDRLTIGELWNHPYIHAEISTSVKEGFGLNFIYPSIATRNRPLPVTTIGRRLCDIFSDFKFFGMQMPSDAFYDDIRITRDIILKRYPSSKDGNIVFLGPFPHAYEAIRVPEKIRTGKDFSHYSIDEQLVLLDLIDYKALGNRMPQFISYISDRELMGRIARENAAVALDRFSIESTVHRLTDIIREAFIKKEKRIGSGEKRKMVTDNLRLLAFFKRIENHPYLFREK